MKGEFSLSEVSSLLRPSEWIQKPQRGKWKETLEVMSTQIKGETLIYTCMYIHIKSKYIHIHGILHMYSYLSINLLSFLLFNHALITNCPVQCRVKLLLFNI